MQNYENRIQKSYANAKIRVGNQFFLQKPLKTSDHNYELIFL